MSFKNVLPFALFLQLLVLTRTFVVVAGQDGWNLTDACKPFGEESKAYFTYTSNTDEIESFVLTADWGEAEPQVRAYATDSEQQEAEFTHIFASGGTYATAFTVKMGEQVVTLRKDCIVMEPEPDAVTGEAPASAESAATTPSIMASSLAANVALAAVALGYISTSL